MPKVARFNKDERVEFKGKQYTIASVMLIEHSNWVYSLRPLDSTYYGDMKTVFNEQESEVKRIENTQLSLF